MLVGLHGYSGRDKNWPGSSGEAPLIEAYLELPLLSDISVAWVIAETQYNTSPPGDQQSPVQMKDISVGLYQTGEHPQMDLLS